MLESSSPVRQTSNDELQMYPDAAVRHADILTCRKNASDPAYSTLTECPLSHVDRGRLGRL